MGDSIIAEAAPQAQPEPATGPELAISLEGVHVDFPDGWWDDPSNDLVLRDGRTMLQARIDGLALVIATTLKKLVAQRQQRVGLVDPTGRPL